MEFIAIESKYLNYCLFTLISKIHRIRTSFRLFRKFWFFFIVSIWWTVVLKSYFYDDSFNRREVGRNSKWNLNAFHSILVNFIQFYHFAKRSIDFFFFYEFLCFEEFYFALLTFEWIKFILNWRIKFWFMRNCARNCKYDLKFNRTKTFHCILQFDLCNWKIKQNFIFSSWNFID